MENDLVAQLRLQKEDAEREKREKFTQLVDITAKVDALVEQAKPLAEELGLVFAYDRDEVRAELGVVAGRHEQHDHADNEEHQQESADQLCEICRKSSLLHWLRLL